MQTGDTARIGIQPSTAQIAWTDRWTDRRKLSQGIEESMESNGGGRNDRNFRRNDRMKFVAHEIAWKWRREEVAKIAPIKMDIWNLKWFKRIVIVT